MNKYKRPVAVRSFRYLVADGVGVREEERSSTTPSSLAWAAGELVFHLQRW